MLDEERVSKLSIQLLKTIKPQLSKDPGGRDNVLAVLSALSRVSATVIVGTEDPLALEYFSQALNHNLEEVRQLHHQSD